MCRFFQIALLAFAFSTCVVRAEGESVLWWMFSEDTQIAEVNGGAATTIDKLVGRGEAAGKTVNAIRVAAYDGDSLLGYLAIADGDGENMNYYYMPSLVKQTSGGTTSYVDSWNAGPTYAVIAPYASTPGVSFMIELGNWDDTAASGSEWTILAHSDKETMEDLDNFIHSSVYDIHTTLEWKGGQYSVPEPSSGLLLLIGGALLALRRRPRG